MYICAFFSLRNNSKFEVFLRSMYDTKVLRVILMKHTGIEPPTISKNLPWFPNERQANLRTVPL